ncbi:MAG: MBL fold metallo-hydrolase [Candidatus Thorarchaeota archaeon]|nr:MBL fold metallo-hydrolase [Candidatus Thorarchaeota archaeon]
MTLRKLVDGLFVDTDGTNGGNHGAIVLEDEVVMIDSGMIHPKSLETKEFLTKKTGLPILKLVFTHSHGDHVFGAQAFEPVSLIASAPMRQRCEDNLKGDWKIETLRNSYAPMKEERPELWEAIQDLSIRLPDTIFKTYLFLGNNEEISVKLLGGHTAGSSTIISHPHNAIFVGDLIFSGKFPYGGDPTCDPDRWIMALEEILALGLETIIPGHGPVCGLDELEIYIQALMDLRANVEDATTADMTISEFIEEGMIPKDIAEGAERFADRTLKHWFQFYG